MATTGDDTNPGTLDQPLRTISKADELIAAAGMAGPGSEIHVMPGSYDENLPPANAVELKADGRDGCPITLTSHDPSDRAVISGGGNGTGIFLDYAAYRVVRFLVVENATHGIGGYYKKSLIEQNEVRNILATGGVNPTGIGTNSDPYNDDNTIRFNLIHNVRTDGTGATMNAMGIGFFQGNRNVICNNEVYDANAGIRQKHQQDSTERPLALTICRNYLHDLADVGIGLGSSNADVYENIIDGAVEGVRIGYGDNYQANNGFRDNVVHNNTMANVAVGVNMQWGTVDQQTFDNEVRDNLVVASSLNGWIQDWQNIAASDHNCYARDAFRTPDANPTTMAALQMRGLEQSSLVSAITLTQYALPMGHACRNASSTGVNIGAYADDAPDFVVGIPGRAAAAP